MYASLLNLPGLDQLRRDIDHWLGQTGQVSGIRSSAPGSFPPVNVGSTPASVEVFAFAPGLDPARVEVVIDRGVLTLAGERAPSAAITDASATANRPNAVSVYARERPSGSFRRAVSLPEDADPTQVQARYRDGVLHVSVPRRQAAQPTRVTVQ